MSNPFDTEDGSFLVLENGEGQHSLWPDFVDVPEGWVIAYEAGSRSESLAYIEKNWTDMRPKSLAKLMS